MLLRLCRRRLQSAANHRVAACPTRDRLVRAPSYLSTPVKTCLHGVRSSSVAHAIERPSLAPSDPLFCLPFLEPCIAGTPVNALVGWSRHAGSPRCRCRPGVWHRALSSSARSDGENYAVGVVHPRRTAVERLEHLRSALENLPVFPLGNTVVFPGAVCPLYVFEPRYRVLVQRLLSEGAHRCFGICGSVTPGQPIVVGTIVEITHNHWNEDGSASVVTRGVCRFSAPTSAIVTNAFGYDELPAVAEVLTDEDDANSLLQQLNIAMGDDEEREAEQDDDKESSLAESSTRSELETAADALEDLLLRRSPEHTRDDFGLKMKEKRCQGVSAFSMWLASAIGGQASMQQLMLEQTSTMMRLGTLHSFIEQVTQDSEEDENED